MFLNGPAATAEGVRLLLNHELNHALMHVRGLNLVPVSTCLRIEFSYYNATGDLESFTKMWGD